MAAVLVLEPIFEADLPPEQYAYRPDRSALDAVNAVHALVNSGHTEVVDADLSGYFDSIPHSELMKSLARRLSDRHLLHLLKQWLQMAVEETDERGCKQRTTRNKDEGKGTPQGAPISPLLANLYMRRFVLGWKELGHKRRLGASLVNYADDFVICCRGNADEAMAVMRNLMSKLKPDGEREEDAAVSVAGRDVRFSGLHHRPVLLPEDGRGLSEPETVAEKGQSHLRRDLEPHRATHDIAVGREDGRASKPHVGGMGELLLPGACQPGLSSDRSARASSAASVVVREAQGAGSG